MMFESMIKSTYIDVRGRDLEIEGTRRCRRKCKKNI
jgi:hypothetical protein